MVDMLGEGRLCGGGALFRDSVSMLSIKMGL